MKFWYNPTMDNEPQKDNKGQSQTESSEEKMIRVQEDARHALNTISDYALLAKVTKSDEEMRQTIKEFLITHPPMPYMDYLREFSRITTKEQIDAFYPEYDSIMTKFIERLKSPDARREELKQLFDKINQFTKE